MELCCQSLKDRLKTLIVADVETLKDLRRKDGQSGRLVCGERLKTRRATVRPFSGFGEENPEGPRRGSG